MEELNSEETDVEIPAEESQEKPISLFRAALIPVCETFYIRLHVYTWCDYLLTDSTCISLQGVSTYAMALFFVKFVNYVFMYWLPKYINSSSEFSFIIIRIETRCT